jgi:hypothetical protein
MVPTSRTFHVRPGVGELVAISNGAEVQYGQLGQKPLCGLDGRTDLKGQGFL